MRIQFGTVLAGLVLLVAAGQVITLAPIDSVATGNKTIAGQCQNNGVSLIVDFGELSDKKIVTCVSNYLGDGWGIFNAAGIEIKGTSEYPNAFMCRITGLPDAGREDCAGTPSPASGYWQYFFATHESGETWVYSAIGAATREPKCGDVEGWLFVTEKNQGASGPSITPIPIKC